MSAATIHWHFILIFLTLLASGPVLPYTCRSPSGNEVDWFVAYKLPGLNLNEPALRKGTAFLYADSLSKTWLLSNASVLDDNSAIGYTVGQLFKAKSDPSKFYALYNDEDPNTGKTDSNRAHMKGVLVFEDISGFWLVHSVPKFPKSTGRGGYAYPESGKRNGQSFLCITFPSSALLEIGKQLFVSQPNIYDAKLPPSYERLFPDLANAVNKKTYPKGKPSSSILQLRSFGGQTFSSFYKHKKFNEDLYDELVAPELHASLYTETWMVGKGDLPSECSRPSANIHNIQSMRFTQPSGIAFKNTEDHSKWAVSAANDQPWVCIGDINRQKSQAKRGGGTVCFVNARIAALYRSAIADVECCDSESTCAPS